MRRDAARGRRRDERYLIGAERVARRRRGGAADDVPDASDIA